jgi:uncharacterized protein
MTTEENKQLMQSIFLELSKGNDKPFLEAMSDDMQWNWMGSGPWSRSFIGKSSVLNDLWAAVRTTIKQPFRILADRIMAEGSFVIIEAHGENTTPDGKIYNNRYCWVCRMDGGKLCEINEYMDTDLVTKTFGG